MRLPSLSGLRVGADAEAEAEAEPPAPKPELSADLIASVLAAVEGGEYEAACRAAARWCALNKAHRDACRDDDAAWRALGARVFAGAPTLVEGDARANFYAMCDRARYYRTWNEYHAAYPNRARPASPDDRVKAYVLAWLANVREKGWRGYWYSYLVDGPVMEEVMHMPPEFEDDRDVLLAIIRSGIDLGRFGSSDAAGHVLRDLPQWRDDREIVAEVVRQREQQYRHASERLKRDPEIVKLAVEQEHAIRHYGGRDRRGPFAFVPTDLPNYGEFARLAVQQVGRSLQYVPTDRDDYGAIARIAVQQEGEALRYVPKDRADYGALARLAMQNGHYVLRSVPTDRDDYGELARLAVQQDGYALRHVPTDRDDFGTIAELAVQQDGAALKSVPTDRDDYGALARLAVQQDGFALQYVPTDRDDYGELARLALAWNPGQGNDDGGLFLGRANVLAFVPNDRDDYGALARLAVEQFPVVPSSERGPNWSKNPLSAIDHADPDDYAELARRSVEKNPWALDLVKVERLSDDDYAAIARIAIARDWENFMFVSVDQERIELYTELARFAIQQDVHALKYLNKWALGDEFDTVVEELTWIAIEQDVAALNLFQEGNYPQGYDDERHSEWDDMDEPDWYGDPILAWPGQAAYHAFAEYAIERSPNALQYVLKDVHGYKALRRAHEARWGVPRRARRGGARTGEACA